MVIHVSNRNKWTSVNDFRYITKKRSRMQNSPTHILYPMENKEIIQYEQQICCDRKLGRLSNGNC